MNIQRMTVAMIIFLSLGAVGGAVVLADFSPVVTKLGGLFATVGPSIAGIVGFYSKIPVFPNGQVKDKNLISKP